MCIFFLVVIFSFKKIKQKLLQLFKKKTKQKTRTALIPGYQKNLIYVIHPSESKWIS